MMMSTNRIEFGSPTLAIANRSVVLLALLATLVTGCSNRGTDGSASGGADKVTLMLNWFPEAEHGGFYAAKVHGIFEKYQLDVEIRPGGPSAPVAQELVAGRVEFVIGNADDVLVFREEDVPMVALMAPIQNTPRCILVREDSGVDSLSDLGGLTLQAGIGRPYLSFMEAKGLLEGVQVVPYSGVPAMASNEKGAMQGYSFSEPHLAKQSQLPINVLMVSEIGFNPYASCLVTTEDYIASNRDVVRRMVAACQEGWEKYFEDPKETNETILAANEHGMTPEAMEFGSDQLRSLCVTEEVPLEKIGHMEAKRWETLVEQFAELELIDTSKVKAESVFTSEFISSSGN